MLIQALHDEIAAVTHTTALEELCARVPGPFPGDIEKLQFNTGNHCSDLRKPASIYAILSGDVSTVLGNSATNRNFCS
jgi:hypothetical protein